MSQQGLMLLFFVFCMIPVMILFTNHNIFFIVSALFLLVSSIGRIQAALSPQAFEASKVEEDDDTEADENPEIVRFNLGVKAVRNLIVVLFFIYCTFFSEGFVFKLMSAFAIVYWLRQTILDLTEGTGMWERQNRPYERLASFTAGACSILLIAMVAYTKLF